MSDVIVPAMLPKEWRQERWDDPVRPAAVYLDRAPSGPVHFVVQSHDTWRGQPYTGAWRVYGRRAGVIMGLANAALEDGDPRKLTREMVDALLVATETMRADDGLRSLVRQAADIIASILPPQDETSTGGARG